MLTLGLILSHCLFTPPPNWEIADPKMPSQRAIVSFVDKQKGGFCPSINLTHERITLSTEQYLAIVQKNCKANKQKWRHLGKIETKSGPAELVEIETVTKFGPARLLQAILIRNGEAYILTAGALKKDFGKQASLIHQSISSMTLCDDLFALVEDEKGLREAWQKKKEGVESTAFKQMVLEQSNLGIVWQLLMMGL
ncbi:MAG: hypothetical protein JSS30_04410 [Verrucomicrobia bacterium]|nr:hypothetical protein [Verrucomicrobiota bacterium]